MQGQGEFVLGSFRGIVRIVPYKYGTYGGNNSVMMLGEIVVCVFFCCTDDDEEGAMQVIS